MIEPVVLEGIDATQFRGHPVALEVFSGPLDLLLHLVQKEKIDIWEISVAKITEEYLAYLRSLEALNVEIAGEFLVMAASLIRIKSQMLLPRPIRSGADDDAPLTREQLIEKLLEYRRYKDAAACLRTLEEERQRKLPRGTVPLLGKDHLFPLREIRTTDLGVYLREVLHRAASPVPMHEVHMEEIRLEERIEHLLQILRTRAEAVLFTDLLGRRWWRLEWIVTFLATLELARQGRIVVLQEEPFGDLWLVPNEYTNSPVAPVDGAPAQGVAA
jgi:segregation and condensation protein A